MGRSPCCDKQQGLKKGPWTPEEDKLLVDCIQANGHGSWRSLPKLAGLQRCGKSCRLRWTNYLRPDIKRGPFTPDEQKSIIHLHAIVGNKWSTIAAQLPGRTDNEIKNYWNTHLKKRLLRMGINPDLTYAPSAASPLSSAATTSSSSSSAVAAAAAAGCLSSSFTPARHMAQWESARLEAEARLSRQSLLFSSSATGSSSRALVLATTEHSDTDNPSSPQQKKEPVDVFLRMWHSNIGESFRKQKTSIKEEGETVASSNDDQAELSSSSKQSSALTVSATGNADRDEEGSQRREEADSRSSVVAVANEAAELSDETYQFYLDLAAGDELSLFQNQLGSCYSFFGSELNEATALDHNPFK